MGKQVSVSNIQTLVSSRLRSLRRIEYIISTQSFHTAFYKATEAQRRVCARLVKQGNETALKLWIDELTSDVLGEMSLNSLKRIAKQIRVHNYSRLTKEALIIAIEGERLRRGNHVKDKA